MKTPLEKFMNDPEYHSLVIMLENFIERAQFTPSELREAVIFACINYENRNIRTQKIFIPNKVDESLKILEDFLTNQTDTLINPKV